MAEPDREQIGDGGDNYGQAASQMAKAAKQAGQEAAKQAASKGIEAGANAAAATVRASVEGGKAVAEIAAGTAAGGPWGAALSAAWALRHTLYKVLICICLFMLIIVVIIGSLPTVVTNTVFGLDGVSSTATLNSAYQEASGDVSDIVRQGRNFSINKVKQIIDEGGYDYDLSMGELKNLSYNTTAYDTCYILAAYSVSMNQKKTSARDMSSKLSDKIEQMFPISYVEKTSEKLVPVSYATYEPVEVTVITGKTPIGTINGVTQYRYETAVETYYRQSGTESSDTEKQITDYQPVNVETPIYNGGTIIGSEAKTFYIAAGTTTIKPEIEIVKYVVCTIHPFDRTVISDAFNLDTEKSYDQFGRTYGEIIDSMAKCMRMMVSGNTTPPDIGGVFPGNGERPGNPAVIEIAKAEIGNVGGYPYWSWYGFDYRVEWCACFVSWCYNRVGKSEPRFSGCTSGGMAWFQSRGQWGDRNYPNIAPGDSIFFDWDGTGDADHVGLVVGTDGTNVYTIEGNSGDECKARSYPLGSDVIRGYGLMVWD